MKVYPLKNSIIRQYAKPNGVTLLELIVTLAIILILAITAMTVYSSYARRSRRIDAVNTVLAISLAQERFRANNPTYGTILQVWGGVTTSPGGYYTLTISNISATTYTITATGIGTQSNDTTSGVSCSTLTFTMANGTATKTPAVCWP